MFTRAFGFVTHLWTKRDTRSRRDVRSRWGRAVSRPHKLQPLRVASESRSVECGDRALDPRTAADLNLDAVFGALDRTNCRLGQEALYHRLHREVSADERESLERVVQLFTRDADARERAQLALQRLNDPAGYDLWWLGSQDAMCIRRWHVVFPVLTAAAVVCAVASVLASVPWPALAVIAGLGVVARIASADDIATTGVALRQLAPLVSAGEVLARIEFGGSPEMVGRFRSDLVALRRLSAVSRWLGGDPFLLSTRGGVVPALIRALGAVVFEYMNILLLLDANAVFFAAADLQRHGAALLRVLEMVGDVDVALSIASWRAEREDWTIPVLTTPSDGYVARDLKHPLVKNAVPNSVCFAAGSGALVTGSNMSGKSTFLRTVGVNAVLGQSLNTSLARLYEAPEYRVRSCIGRADDILAGKSYYVAEIEAVLDCVRAAEAGIPHLILFDELFRGTNTVERVAAADAVLRTVASGVEHMHVTIAATHDAELVDLLGDVMPAYHFGERMTDDGLSFDFTLTPGTAKNRNAIALLARHGAPEALISRALAAAAELDGRRSHPAQR